MGKLVFLENTKNTNQLLTKSGICKEQIKKVNALIKKIEDQELIISIFGQFKRGKSTFINTILGEDILPMGIVPVTSVVTKIKYGPKRAEICFRDFSKDIPLADLNQYVDERNNPDNNKGVSFVNIFYPCALLEKGITIVDTPGIGSMHKHNSDAAYEFVKESDAVIFMISVDSPINEMESDFLSQIKEYASKIYFAANKIDIVSHTELEEYIIYCQKIISNVMNTQDIKLYPISAKDKMDIGVQRLISDVTADIEKFGEDILMESVIIKLKDIINEAIGYIQIYISALTMPLDKLEETEKILGQKLNILENMSKEVIYLIDQRTDDLMKSIREAFNNEQQLIIDNVTETIIKAYNEDSQLSPKLLDAKLRMILKTELTQILINLNDKGISLLKSGFENATNMFIENVNTIYDYLSSIAKELFNVQLTFEKESYSLSEASDFYINIFRFEPSFLFDTKKLIFYLPKFKANPIILTRVKDCAKDSVSRNITNILSDYAYKIRESNRTFKSDFSSKIEVIETDFKIFIEKIITERRKVNDQRFHKIKVLEETSFKLNNIANRLNN